MWRPLKLIILLLIFTSGCNRAAEAPASQRQAGCIDHFDPAADYFPQKVKPEFAVDFSVEYHDSYKAVTVRKPAEDGTEERYVLLQCGAPKPTLDSSFAAAPIITIPIKSLYSGSSTHLPLLVDLDRVDVLSGVSQVRYITTPAILEWIRQGHVIEYAPNDVIDTELVISKSPTVLMQSGGPQQTYSTLRKAGIAVVSNAEWQEPTALGRAEWIKYMALFLNEENKATQHFNEIRDRYMVLRERTRAIPVKDRPTVMTGSVFRGMFEIAGGASYASRMISDAGATYVWSGNTSTGGISVDMEAQIARASGADFWINGGDWKSLKTMLAEEPRYTNFRPFQKGQVWLYNRLMNETGGSDYWSRGITRPDLILGDLIKIFHPELAKDHEFVWYKQVPAE